MIIVNRTFRIFSVFNPISAKPGLSAQLLVAIAALLFTYAHANPQQLQEQLREQQTRQQELARELEANRDRRTAAEEELKQQQSDLQIRTLQLETMRGRLGENPDPAELGRVNNEQQRLRLAELSVQSQMATIVRLERQEKSTSDELAQVGRAIRRTEQAISERQAELQREEQRRADEAAARVAALEAENEALKRFAQAEQEAAEARARAQEEARIAEEEAEAMAMEEMPVQSPPPSATPTPSSAAPAARAQDTSRVVLDDEPPIYEGDDGRAVILRSQNISAPLTLEEVAPNRYQAEARVSSGRAYFDILQRRYRGAFPDDADQYIYRFTYDISDPERPQLQVGRRRASN